ncbi:hypothetical protein M433DRAFT_138071 [Acidomyces richmondensis BFW]|nr:MAG: hypothetical protein FE78DRAFT_29252 [Acidomyces sp. 'richmondensis']KYG41386.1 hypothetical protein M433DRAFT_138071 [Acidomyces richmondensis BFW]
MSPLSSLAVLYFFTLGSFAAPYSVEQLSRRWQGYCLTDADAQQVATNYANLIQLVNGWEEIANTALSPNFVDYSESVNTLIDTCPQGSAAITLPLLNPTFSNRTQFELGQGQQQPINFQQLNIWHSCDSVIIRWETTNTANIPNVKPVVGMITMETCPAPQGNEYPYYIDTVYSEFDAGAWLQNLQAAGICNQSAGSSSEVSSTGSIPPGTSTVGTSIAATSTAVYPSTTA